MRHRCVSLPAIEAALIEDNQRRCKPPLDDAEVRQIVSSIGRYPIRDRGSLSVLDENEGDAERKALPFRTAADFSVTAHAEPPWICKPWVAKNCITEITGKIKNGKTTFLMGLVGATASGSAFLGQATTKTGVIYLSEERDVTLSEALKRASLRQSKNLALLLANETNGWSWPSLVSAAAEKCRRRGAGVLVVDTFAQFAGLEHSQENSSGDVLAAVKPLQQAAASGLAVVIVHHERKGGGDVADSGRGSSALAGAVDVVASIRRPDGSTRRNVRLVHTVSRFSETPPELLIELTGDGYRTLGTPGKVATEEAESEFLEMLPKTKKLAMTTEDLIKKAGEGRAHVQRLLDALLETEKIRRIGKGRKRDPYRYYAT
jgi:AAA domain/Primase C terminal 1 (PriCT-1)